MPRNISWGQSDQTNTLNLVDALQKLAAGELEANLGELNTEVLAQWVSECKLRVTGKVKRKRGKREQTVEEGTTKKALVKLVEASGKGLELPKRTTQSSRSRYERQAEAIQTVIDSLRELGILEEEPSQKNQGYWKFSLNLTHQTKPAENLEKIRQKWQERTGQTLVETLHATSLQVTDEGINWREICHAMLEKRRRATSNILMQEESAKFAQEQIYVPLALVERKKQDKRDREFLPEKGTQLYEPQYQETQRFEHNAFLSQILEKGEGKSQGKQIALIGEPGAGKTTLLQAIAFWLLEKNLGLPIWINLADLSGKDISTYVLEVWLNQAIPPTRLNQRIRDDLVKQIEQGRVLLLLDGVDEMVASTVKLNNARNWGDSSFHSVPLRMTSENPLQAMADQLTGWINQARVVLTCRLNVWLASTNALETFETYRLLDFDYPHQVHQFIDNWFNPPQPTFERGEQDGSICLYFSQDTSTIKHLTKLLKTERGDRVINISLLAACDLLNTDPENQDAIRVLRKCIKPGNESWDRLEAASALSKTQSGKQEAITVLYELRYESVKVTQEINLLKKVIDSLNQIEPRILPSPDWSPRTFLKEDDLEFITGQLASIHEHLIKQNSIDDEILYIDDEILYEFMWIIAQNTAYPIFYKAWHKSWHQLEAKENEQSPIETTTPANTFTLKELPQRLYTALETKTQIGEIQDLPRLISIDANKFIDRENPSAKIYHEMRCHGFPKSSHGTPQTLAQLQAYWDEQLIESDKPIVWLFYNSTSQLYGEPPPEDFSPIFLANLSKFDGAIAVITHHPHTPLKSFSPNQPNLVEAIVTWIAQL